MNFFGPFLIVFLLSLLQATVLRINFLLLFVLLKNSYFWAFLSGLVLDLLSVQRLGFSSFLLVLMVFFFRQYSKKYAPRYLFLAVYLFLCSFIFAKIQDLSWSYVEGLILCFVLWFFRKKFKKGKQLKLDL
jgi:hypothetical protein